MKPASGTFLQRWARACVYSGRGVLSVFRREAAFRQELAACAALLPLSAWLGVSRAEHALLAGSVLLVLLAELLNSAIEACIDRIGDTPHPLSAHAKDAGSAAVLVTLCIALLTWLVILL